MKPIISHSHLTDGAVVVELEKATSNERLATSHVISLLSEFEKRRLHLGLGFSSTFEYCIKALRLSEHEAYNRIEVARATRKHPELLAKLESGALSLTAIRLLAPHLTAANFEPLTREAEGKRKEGIKLIIAKLKPQPPVPTVLRKLPERKPATAVIEASEEAPASFAEVFGASGPGTRRPVVEPLSEAHYKLQVTISAAARERLSQIQDLMRHRVPNGDPAAIVEHALEVLHAQLLKEKAAVVARPRAGKAVTEAKGRYIPASVKREVFRRDKGRCAFLAPDGTQCGTGSGVEFHHVRPYAVGGEASVENIEMRCRAHNGFEWERHLDQETAALLAR